MEQTKALLASMMSNQIQGSQGIFRRPLGGHALRTDHAGLYSCEIKVRPK